MYTCSCCPGRRNFLSRKSLYRHERKFSAEYVSPSIRQKVSYESNPVKCEACEKPITFDQYQNAKKNPRFCSNSCSNSVSRKTKEVSQDGRPSCRVCGSALKKNASKFCSNQCLGREKHAETKRRFYAGETTHSDTARKILIEDYGHQCSRCGLSQWEGEKIPLEIDHIDGNASNNTINNFRLLCCNCHALTPTHRGFNRGNGRPERRARYRLKTEVDKNT